MVLVHTSPRQSFTIAWATEMFWCHKYLLMYPRECLMWSTLQEGSNQGIIKHKAKLSALLVLETAIRV